MPIHPHPRQVPGLEEVARALEKAEHGDASGPSFDVCVCNDRRQIVAGAKLASFDRVKRFSRYMHRLGYEADILASRTPGCDVLYIPADNPRDVFDDGFSPTDEAPLR